MTGSLAVAGVSVPAAAQVAIEAAIQTDYRVRGYSISDGQPTASLSLSYDDPSGAYLGGLAIGRVRHGKPQLLGIQASAGYAVRLGPRLSLDAGVSRTQYFYGFRSSRNYDYTELHLGIALPNVTARLRYSPDYYANHARTLYAEIDGGIEPAPNWFLSAHAGALNYLDRPPDSLPKRRYDWRIGATRQFGRYGVHLDLSGRIQDRSQYGYLPYGAPRAGTDQTALVLSLTRAL